MELLMALGMVIVGLFSKEPPRSIWIVGSIIVLVIA